MWVQSEIWDFKVLFLLEDLSDCFEWSKQGLIVKKKLKKIFIIATTCCITVTSIYT